MAWQKSVVGAGVFTHEAGIHVDGLLKDRRNYENFAPEELGRRHQLVLLRLQLELQLLRQMFLQTI